MNSIINLTLSASYMSRQKWEIKYIYTHTCIVVQWPRALCPWSSPGQNTGGCHFLLQGIFLSQELNPIFCIGRQILYYFAIREARCYNYSYVKVNILEGSMELSGVCGEGFPPFSNSYYYYDQNTTGTGLNSFKTIDQRSKECVSGVTLAHGVDFLLQKSNYYGKQRQPDWDLGDLNSHCGFLIQLQNVN